MITMLFAATLAGAAPNPAPSSILKDLPARPLDAQAKPPLLRDLHGPATNPLDPTGSSPILKVLPPGAMPPLGSLSAQDRDKLALAGKLCVRPALKTLGPKGAPVQKLGDLPPGLLEHAVNRMVNGCPVREIVSGGQTYYLDAPTGGLERLDPVVYPAKPPARER